MNVTWSIATETLPDYLPDAVVKAAVKSALRYIERKALDQVQFEEVDLETHPQIAFGFESISIAHNGRWDLIRPGRYAITFNTRYQWAARSGLGVLRDWATGRSQSFRIVCIHEVLHCLGLRDHNPDSGSVMYSHPKFPHITANDQWLLLAVTRRPNLF
jgi:hypothetical protein